MNGSRDAADGVSRTGRIAASWRSAAVSVPKQRCMLGYGSKPWRTHHPYQYSLSSLHPRGYIYASSCSCPSLPIIASKAPQISHVQSPERPPSSRPPRAPNRLPSALAACPSLPLLRLPPPARLSRFRPVCLHPSIVEGLPRLDGFPLRLGVLDPVNPKRQNGQGQGPQNLRGQGWVGAERRRACNL